jgi:hypothetical protein
VLLATTATSEGELQVAPGSKTFYFNTTCNFTKPTENSS